MKFIADSERVFWIVFAMIGFGLGLLVGMYLF